MPERFNVSSKFESRSASFLNEVLPEVDLPEDINVLTPRELDNPPKPFVVVTFQPSVKEGIKCYEAGAIRYVTMDFDKTKLRSALEGKK